MTVSSRPEASALRAAYDELLARAAAAGLTEPGGLTPREHLARLKAGEVLPARDLADLTRIVERACYADLPGGEAEAAGLAASLARRLPKPALTAAPPPPRPRRRRRRKFGGLITIPALVGLFVVWGIAVLLLKSSGGESQAWTASAGGPAGRSFFAPGIAAAEAEAEAVYAAAGDWDCPEQRATYVSVDFSAAQAFAAEADSVGFDFATGQDLGMVDDFREPLKGLGARYRLNVYDVIGPSGALVRRGAPLTPATGAPPEDADEYSGELWTELRAGVPAPIPSPGPDPVVFGATTSPPAGLAFQHDPAGGLVATADRTGAFTIRWRSAVAPGYFDAPLPATPWNPAALSPRPVPKSVALQARQVIAAIGGLPAPTYEKTVRRLQAYFATFSVAPIERSEQRATPYLTVALARKGVCRHRARAFVITANALGLPARLVENEIHSFAEVQLPDGRWRALEFRLNPVSPERPPLPTRYAPWIAGLFPPILGALWLGWRARISDLRAGFVAPEVALGARRGRPDEGLDAERSVLALVAHARRRLREVLGVDPYDAPALEAALAVHGASPLTRRRTSVLLSAATAAAHGRRFERQELADLHWTARAVLADLRRRPS